MVAFRVDGALKPFGITMGWVCGRIFGGDGSVFLRFLTFSVVNGERVKFWHDQWCGVSPLKGAFPELFSIAADKDAVVADLLSVRNGKIHWEVTFVRNVQD
jgi:hypothetical protein